jgi:hypothetical protein
MGESEGYVPTQFGPVLDLMYLRCLDSSPGTYLGWQNYHRHNARYDAGNKLDCGKLVLLACMSPFICPTPLTEVPQFSYLVFHWATGIPFQNELHGGAYDELTLWEQIDDGAQYTPAKKWLITCPIIL